MKEKVVFVHPEGKIFQLLKNGLKNYGFKVMEFKDIHEAFKKINSDRPHILILEVSITENWQLCKFLKLDKHLKNIPILILSDKTDANNMIRTKKYSIEGYITRPYDSDSLVKMTVEILKKKKEIKKTVLVVEEDPSVLDIIKINLTYAGYNVITATSAIEALEIARKKSLSLVITDIMMPEMDGIEFSLQLRDIPFKDDIPVMIVSAKDDFNEISHAYTIGISEYITKPFDPVELIEKVRRILCSD